MNSEIAIKSKTESPSITSRELAIEIAQLAADTKCSGVRLLDMAGRSPVCDYVVLATGTSARQMRSVAGEIDERVSARGGKVFGTSASGEQWIAIDLVDILVHVFSHDARMYYDMDNLWADAVDVPWKRA